MSISWACLAVGIVILVIGAVTFAGRFHTLFKDWKRMPEEEKRKIHIKPLCHNIGAAIMVCGALILAAAFSSFFLQKMFSWFMLGWFILAAADIWFISRSKRYMDK
ncbi:MAG: DUF3784 domain-containing protein [Clostridia bacterium]|nr:DUF3784 domain-containing protein [Clostridia bacterium]